MIEFLPPRDGAFGESEGADFVGFDGDDAAAFGDEPPQSRWLTAFAVLGVTGLLAGGVIAAAPWDDEVATPPPTTSTTVPTTTTIPRSTTTTEPGLPPGVSADIPGMMLDDPTASRYVLVDAQSIDDGFVSDTATALWSTPGATRTSGAWVAIVSREQMGDFQELRRGGMRATMGDRRVLVDIAVDQVVEVVVPPSRGGAFSVHAFGISLDDLTRIVSATSVGSGDIDVGDLADPGGPLDGLEQVVDLDGRSDGAGWLAYSYFIDPTGQRSMQATLTNADPPSELVETLVWTRPIDPTTIDASIETSVAELRADHPDVELLQSANADGYLAVRWRLPSGDRVTVWGDAPVADLIQLASHLELAEPDEWRDAVITSLNGFESAGDFAIDPPVEIDDAERRWTASAGDGRFTISGEGFWYSSRFEAPTGPHLEAYLGNSVAFVRATNTWPNDGLQVVVTQPGLEPTSATLVQVNDTLDFIAVVEIDGDLPYEVQWLDLDGVPIDGPTTAVP